MAKTRREFAPEFKREAVALLASSGRPLTRVAAICAQGTDAELRELMRVSFVHVLRMNQPSVAEVRKMRAGERRTSLPC